MSNFINASSPLSSITALLLLTSSCSNISSKNRPFLSTTTTVSLVISPLSIACLILLKIILKNKYYFKN
ncbi:TPA: hypothetical protein ACQNFN_001585, partial [Streptococcus pyogenes]